MLIACSSADDTVPNEGLASEAINDIAATVEEAHLPLDTLVNGECPFNKDTYEQPTFFAEYDSTRYHTQIKEVDGLWQVKITYSNLKPTGNVWQYDVEEIVAWYSKSEMIGRKCHFPLDSATYHLYNIYEKWEEYSDGASSHQCSKWLHECAKVDRVNSKTHYEVKKRFLPDDFPEHQMLVISTDRPTIYNITYLRSLAENYKRNQNEYLKIELLPEKREWLPCR